MAQEQLAYTGAPQSFLFRVHLTTRFLQRGWWLNAFTMPVFLLATLLKARAMEFLNLLLWVAVRNVVNALHNALPLEWE